MPLANYTTTVAAAKSVTQMQALLVANGAESVQVEYRGGAPDSLTFRIRITDQPVHFRLDANVDGVRDALKRAKVTPAYLKPEHALKVAWRILYDWLRAQLAIIEAGIVTLPQVMLPYAVTDTGATVYQRLAREGPGLLRLTEGP